MGYSDQVGGSWFHGSVPEMHAATATDITALWTWTTFLEPWASSFLDWFPVGPGSRMKGLMWPCAIDPGVLQVVLQRLGSETAGL